MSKHWKPIETEKARRLLRIFAECERLLSLFTLYTPYGEFICRDWTLVHAVQRREVIKTEVLEDSAIIKLRFYFDSDFSVSFTVRKGEILYVGID
ncbi:MAG: hypothetical protein QW318_07185 [Candidatus Caldarchaeum sp.]